MLSVFFLLFTSASLLIPSPMFPGSIFCLFIGEAVNEFSGYLSALINGLFYSLILWIVFVILSKRLEGK